MTQDLPAGVVTTTDKITTELDSFDDIDVDDIAQLWRGTALLFAICSKPG
jgi:hypothetical protein